MPCCSVILRCRHQGRASHLCPTEPTIATSILRPRTSAKRNLPPIATAIVPKYHPPMPGVTATLPPRSATLRLGQPPPHRQTAASAHGYKPAGLHHIPTCVCQCGRSTWPPRHKQRTAREEGQPRDATELPLPAGMPRRRAASACMATSLQGCTAYWYVSLTVGAGHGARGASSAPPGRRGSRGRPQSFPYPPACRAASVRMARSLQWYTA